MSLDTKYRPVLFSEVVGQKGTIQILKNLLKSGSVLHKSYIFAGPSGTGKTTIARILARAMLCPHLTSEQEPCNVCTSCQEILTGSSSFNFVEMDAANNSGVGVIRQMVESSDYYTLGDKNRKIYLVDEAHRLSAEATDALLKPMEDCLPGSQDKRLSALLCTTDPDKFRVTLKARCMTFGIKEPERDEAIERLRYIADQEGISYEEDALEMIFNAGRGHMRDMVTGLDRVSRMGDLTVQNTGTQLGFSVQSKYYLILKNLGPDPSKALEIVQEALHMVTPTTLYQGLAQTALSSYRTSMGQSEGVMKADLGHAKEIYTQYRDSLLYLADRILSSQRVWDLTMLTCELMLLHRFLLKGTFELGTSVLPVIETSPSTKEVEASEARSISTTQPALSNHALSRDNAFDDVYGNMGYNFVNAGKRIDNSVEVKDTSSDSVSTVADIAHPNPSKIADTRSLFDD